MPLTYVGGVTASGTGNTYVVDLTALAGGAGASPQENDIVVVVTGFSSASDLNPGVDQVDYTQVFNGYANDTRDANMAVAWKRMGAVPDTTVRVYGSGSASYGGVTAVHVWRGADPDSSFDATPTSVSGTNSAQADAPSITTETPSAIVLACMLSTGDTTPLAKTVPAGMGNFVTASGAGSTSSAIAGIASVSVETPTAYNPAAWSGGESTTSDSWLAVSLAIRPIEKTSTVASVSAAIECQTPQVVLASVGSVTFAVDGATLSVSCQAPFSAPDLPRSPSEAQLAVASHAPTMLREEDLVVIPGWADPYYEQVVSLLRFDQATVVDEVGNSWYDYATTLSGSTFISGVGSRYFDGAINAYLRSDGFPVGANDFCIELKVYPTTTGTVRGLVSQRPYAAGYISYSLAIAADNTLQFVTSLDGTAQILAASTLSVLPNAWSHIAAERYNEYLYVYINGWLAGTPVYVGSGALYTNNIYFWLGKRDGYDYSSSNPDFTGYMDEFRLTIGVARYRGTEYAEPDNSNMYMLPYAPAGGRDVVEITGLAPAVVVPAVVLSEPGASALAVVGEPPELVIGPRATPEAAQVALSASAPVLEQTLHQYPSPPAGFVTFAMSEPLARESELTTISTAAGSLSVGMLGTNAVQNELPSPAAASIAIAGYQVTLQRLLASTSDPDALTVSGHALTLMVSVGEGEQPSAGTVTVSGHVPAAAIGIVSLPGASGIVVAGYQSSLATYRVASPGSTGLSVTGNASGLSTGNVATPGSGALTVVGIDPTPLSSVRIQVDETTVAIGTEAAGIIEHSQLSGGYDELIVTRYAPVVLADSHEIAVGAGAVVIVGAVPDAEEGATLVIVGEQPSIGDGLAQCFSAEARLVPAMSCEDVVYERGWE